MNSTRFAGLSTMDQVANATLPTAALARYSAYRNALIADGQDAGRVVELLELFIWELMEGCSANGVH
jgi:hypothetical protein